MVTINGCSSDASNIIHFVLTGNESGGNQNIVVFPNPSDGRFYLAGKDYSGRATVYDLTGVKVYDDRIKMNLLDLGDLPSGIYLLTISTTGKTSHFKIQILH